MGCVQQRWSDLCIISARISSRRHGPVASEKAGLALLLQSVSPSQTRINLPHNYTCSDSCIGRYGSQGWMSLDIAEQHPVPRTGSSQRLLRFFQYTPPHHHPKRPTSAVSMRSSVISHHPIRTSCDITLGGRKVFSGDFMVVLFFLP